ncbi:phage capsid protein [Diaphorobacter ruginosibacter]|uniref:recombination directionality factor n=1 Tax=Diaphorobacter ruginosibacter TaxID=1715720 RepID=UPI001CB6FFD6|nr:phage capsid protein [Diaphorobacter ruginosibacter]
MIKGLMMTPPVVGRISIGKVIERNGKRLPEKDDEFTITTQVQSRRGWVLHPMDAILRAEITHRALMTTGVEVTELQALPPEFQDAPKPPKQTLQDKLARRARATQLSQATKGDSEQGTNLEQKTMTEVDSLADGNAPAHAHAAKPKLRSIPIRVLFNDPALNLRANYTLFDRATARPLCVGDGQTCKRMTGKGIEASPCEGPDLCALAIEGGCKPFGRFHMRIDHPDNQADAMSTFVLRTTGINSLRTLMTRMQYLQAASGGLLAYLPLELRLRAKSTAMSHRTPIYYVDLGIRNGMPLDAAISQAAQAADYAQKVGHDQEALEQAAREGYALGLFEELEQEATEIVQEFYPAAAEPTGQRMHLKEVRQPARGRGKQHG